MPRKFATSLLVLMAVLAAALAAPVAGWAEDDTTPPCGEPAHIDR